MNKLEHIHRENLKTDIPDFNVGDTVRVNVRIVEAGTERLQPFTGMVIARNGGGVSETVTVRRISYGQGVEQVFPLHSPRVHDIKVVRKGEPTRAKLYYLRYKTGKVAGMR